MDDKLVMQRLLRSIRGKENAAELRAYLEKAMAWPHQRWIDKVRDDYLCGAFGEFMCRQVAVAVGKPDNWSTEVVNLLYQVDRMLDPALEATTFKRRDKALTVALGEASRDYSRVTHARSKVAGYYPNLLKKIYRLKLDSVVEFRKMIVEFRPQYEKYLDPCS